MGREALAEEEQGSHKDEACSQHHLGYPRHHTVSQRANISVCIFVCVRVSVCQSVCLRVCVGAWQLCGNGHRRASEFDHEEEVEEASTVVRHGWARLRVALPAGDSDEEKDHQGQVWSVSCTYLQGQGEGHKQVTRHFVSVCQFISGAREMARRKSGRWDPPTPILWESTCGGDVQHGGRARQGLACGETPALPRQGLGGGWEKADLTWQSLVL